MCHGPRISLPGIAAAFSFRIPFLSYAPSSPSPAAAFGPAADSPHNLPADAVGPLTTFQLSAPILPIPRQSSPLPSADPEASRQQKNGFHLRGNRCKVTVPPGKGACRRRARRKPGKTSGTRESAEAVGTPPKPWKTGCRLRRAIHSPCPVRGRFPGSLAETRPTVEKPSGRMRRAVIRSRCEKAPPRGARDCRQKRRQRRRSSENPCPGRGARLAACVRGDARMAWK